MLKLTYNRKSDKFSTVTVIGSPLGIRDLYWQLTHNYKAVDGTEIGEVLVTNLDGDKIETIMHRPYQNTTHLDANL